MNRLLGAACFVIGHRPRTFTPRLQSMVGAVAVATLVERVCARCGAEIPEKPAETIRRLEGERRRLQAELRHLNEYVTLWNDVYPVIAEAERVVAGTTGRRSRRIDALAAAIERYHGLYPNHRRAA